LLQPLNLTDISSFSGLQAATEQSPTALINVGEERESQEATGQFL
jgi:hypothetical protein